MNRISVAPLAGVWIEMDRIFRVELNMYVAPLAGVWIEIPFSWNQRAGQESRSPCGSVD